MKPARTKPSVLTSRQALKLAQKVLREKYPGADCAFVTGSIMRGEGTPTSDIDLIVIFKNINNPYRESYIFEKTPVEAFLHDLETLNYFFVADLKDQHAALAHMIATGIVIPKATKISRRAQKQALKIINRGLPKISSREKSLLRYSVTDIIDDLRGGLSRGEQLASALFLFDRMTKIIQIRSGQWLGTGKHNARNVNKASPRFISKYQKALSQLIKTGETEALIKLADDILHPWGGRLFDGYIDHAPKKFRLKKFKK